MNPIKRSSKLKEFSSVEAKKLRITPNEENNKITCIEHLSNEIFYEIFEYLDGYDIYKAFSNLNFRFQHLITCSPLPLKIKFHSKVKSEVAHYCKYLIIPNRHRILSLYFENESIINDFFTHCIIDSSFDRLESIVLADVPHNQLIILLSYLKSLPRLYALIMRYNTQQAYDVSNVYQLIFSLPTLKYNKLSLLTHCYEKLNIFVPLADNDQFVTIEYLIINHNVTFNELRSLLHHVPQLRHLTCGNLIRSDTNVDIKQPILPKMTYLDTGNCQAGFEEVEIFIINTCPQLQILKITQYWGKNYLDADRWERLIENHTPHLRKFDYRYYGFYTPEYADSVSNMKLDRFTSLFWIERQWVFEVRVDKDVVIYSVYPYRKSWFDSYKYAEAATFSDQNLTQTFPLLHHQDIPYSSTQLVPTIQFSIDEISLGPGFQSSIDKYESILVTVQFTRLNINYKNIPIGMLLKIIQLLPNLNSLKLSSLPSIKSGSLADHDENTLFTTSINNKIRKVSFETIANIEEANFIFNLCLRIQYFHVGVSKDMNLEVLVRFILIKASTYISQLKCLCLCISNANEEIIYRLQKLINTEELLANYRIERICNNILLNWNLKVRNEPSCK